LSSDIDISIIIPAYNEEDTIAHVLDLIHHHCKDLNYEIVVIDDGSGDRTAEILDKRTDINFVKHDKNQGKGKALQSGFSNSKGNILIIQDADLEYHPKEIPKLVRPVLFDGYDVVYGSRFFLGNPKGMSFSHVFGNKILTLATQILFRFNTTDMETGYKIFRRSLLDGLTLTANSFNIEPELTAHFSKSNAKFMELPISYQYRKKGEAKITWRDGLIALWWLVKLRIR